MMPRCLVAYFSQGGTTARVAEAIASGLRREGYEVDLARIDAGTPGDLSRYDLVGFGSPAYYFRLPFAVSDYMKRLAPVGRRPAFTFILHGTYPGGAGIDLRRMLALKGARDVGSFCVRGADRFLGYVKLGYLFSHDRPSYQDLVEAEAFGRRVAERAAGDSTASVKNEPNAPTKRAESESELSPRRMETERGTPVIYRLERFLTGRWLVRHLYSRLFRVDPGKCTACDICMRLCPVGNLRPGDGGRPVWGRECLLCLTCEEKCPKEAIRSPVTSFLFRPFLRYNVRRAALDASLSCIRVTHRRGRTESD
jgi:flavodoxin/NAD-dependent dihydropyrimidine dehydrogenase PreA subunit